MLKFSKERDGKLHFLCSDIERKNYLIGSSRQVDVFDIFIKIRFFNSLFLVSVTWLFSILFSSMLSSIGWSSSPSLLTTVLSSSKRTIAYIFLKTIAMIHIQYGPILQTYACKTLNFVCIKIFCLTVKRSFKACKLEVVKKDIFGKK